METAWGMIMAVIALIGMLGVVIFQLGQDEYHV